MTVKIVTDSSANLYALEGVDFASVPLKVIVGEREFTDDACVDLEELYAALADSTARTAGTSCPSVGDWLEAFGTARIVLCITLTSALSGSCYTARLAKREYESLHPGRHVYLVDSLSIGPEMALMAEYARSLLMGGVHPAYVYRALLRYRTRTQLVFALSGLRRCAEGGRVDQATARGVGVMGVGVVGRASETGELEVLEKCRGRRQLGEGLLRQIRRLGYAGGRVRIAHAGDEAGALELMRRIREAFGAVDVRIGPSGALCGFYAEQGGLLVGLEC